LEKTPESIVVVIIDYDDDLGRAGLETPIIGFKKGFLKQHIAMPLQGLRIRMLMRSSPR